MMENRILEPSGRPRTSDLVAELLLLLLLSLSWWIDRQRETSHSLSYSQEQKSWGTSLSGELHCSQNPLPSLVLDMAALVAGS